MVPPHHSALRRALERAWVAREAVLDHHVLHLFGELREEVRGGFGRRGGWGKGEGGGLEFRSACCAELGFDLVGDCMRDQLSVIHYMGGMEMKD